MWCSAVNFDACAVGPDAASLILFIHGRNAVKMIGNMYDLMARYKIVARVVETIISSVLLSGAGNI
jgi:hypothetical protein